MDNKLFNSIACTIGIFIFIMMIALFCDFFQKDLSVRQKEHSTKFGAVYMTLNNPFYTIINEEMRTQIESHGDVLLSRNPHLDEEEQSKEIQELVERGIKVLFINPIDSGNIAGALEKAKAAGVSVVAIDTNVARTDLVDSTVVSDNYMAGVQCAKHLLENKSSGRVAILTHAKATSAQNRIRGFIETLKDKPEFQIVDQADCLGQLELAMPAMEEMLKRHPDIDVVMALNDPSALGAMAALKNAGRLSDTMIYGVDGTPEAMEMIESGLMTGTVSQEPKKIARLAVNEAYKILEKKDVDKLIMIPTVLHTKGSVSPEWIK